MNLFASVLAFVLIPLFFVALHWGGSLIRAVSGGKVSAGLGMIIVLVAGILVMPLLFEAAGHTVEGKLISKSETIETGYYGVNPSAYHHYDALIVSLTGGRPSAEPLDLQISARAFDRLHKGQDATLRLLEFGPLRIARLAAMSWFLAFPVAELERFLSAIAWILTIVALFAIAGFPRFGSRGRAIIVSIVLAAVLIDGFSLRSWWQPRSEHARATIQSVRKIDTAYIPSWFSGSPAGSGDATRVALSRPYDEVQFAFRPSATSDPVVALDRVDAGSAGNLQRGQLVNVDFWPVDPRDARMNRGKRVYAWRNASIVYGAEFAALVLFFLFASGASALGDRLRDAVMKVRDRVRPGTNP